MRFYLVGEGPSDLCDKGTGTPGLLKEALAQLVDLDYDATLCDFRGVSHAQLQQHSDRKQRNPRNMILRGNKRMSGKLADVVRSAEALGWVAKSDHDGGECGAVFFTDCDFTHSEVNDPDKFHLQMIAAIETGFMQSDGYRRGVAMVPKMRSESWLLCKYQEEPYLPTSEFEKLPANDESSTCAKKVLATVLSSSVDDMYNDIIYGDTIDWRRIDCPSYNFFKRRFRYVVCCLAHQSPACTEPETLVTQGARL